jgi:hypothetical protein
MAPSFKVGDEVYAPGELAYGTILEIKRPVIGYASGFPRYGSKTALVEFAVEGKKWVPLRCLEEPEDGPWIGEVH